MSADNQTTTDHGPFEIYLVGLGIMAVRHSTREAEDCLRASKHVYYVAHGFGIPEYLDNLCLTATNLLPEYREGESRLGTYQSMAALVINTALSDPPVCFATYGHPTMYVYPSVLIKRAAALLDLRVHVVPGISMFDTILVDLDFDPGLTGLQMYEATALLVEERSLQSDVPCVLLQVDTVESALFTRAPSNAERFVRLQQHLLRFYPPEHEVIAVMSPTFPILVPIRDRFPLSDLPARYVKGAQSGTLYIPPIRKERPRNIELERQLYDPEHLGQITRPH
jgi:hypothetical protein